MTPELPAQEDTRRWEDNFSGFRQRSDYKTVWNLQAKDMETAKLAVAGYTDEAAFEATARDTIIEIEEAIGLSPYDIILEIGCGVGRVGKLLSKHCHHWIGTDISGEMIRHARERLVDCPNVTLIELSGVGLGEIYSNTLDVVYCTIVYMHLYEWDRYTYVKEAFRTLRPGGRIFFDNVFLGSAAGWEMFEAGRSIPPEKRPAHLSMCSTFEEFRIYLEKAGFTDIGVRLHPNGRLIGTGRKPAA